METYQVILIVLGPVITNGPDVTWPLIVVGLVHDIAEFGSKT